MGDRFLTLMEMGGRILVGVVVESAGVRKKRSEKADLQKDAAATHHNSYADTTTFGPRPQWDEPKYIKIT